MKKFIVISSILCSVAGISQDVVFINDDHSSFYFSPVVSLETENITIQHTFQASVPNVSNFGGGYLANLTGASYRINERMSTGISYLNDQVGGFLYRGDLKLNFAYQVPLGENLKISSGINLGFGQERIDCSGLTFPQTQNDPVCDPSYALLADIGIGLTWKNLNIIYGGLNSNASIENNYSRPVLHNVKAEYNFLFDAGNNQVNITPFARYAYQASFTNLILGSHIKFWNIKTMAAYDFNFWYASLGYDGDMFGIGYLHGQHFSAPFSWPVHELRISLKL